MANEKTNYVCNKQKGAHLVTLFYDYFQKKFNKKYSSSV